MRNSDDYKEKMKAFEKAREKMQIEIKEYRNSDEFKRTMIEARKVAEKVRMEMSENKEMWEEQAKAAKEAGKKAMEMVKKMKEEGKLHAGENVYFLGGDANNSNIKIKKYLKITVPKNATFDLNVRHGKLNVPKSNKKMSANISYGNFIGGIINGEKNELNFTNSPVEIQTVNSGNITLKNVPNATFGTFSNSNLFANSSDVIIGKIGNNVALSQKFGNLEIREISNDFNLLNLILDYAKANLYFSDAAYVYQINSKNSTFKLLNKSTETMNKTTDGVKFTEGFLHNKSSQNKVLITGVYSTVILN